jgi:hypothetical protein
VSKRGKMPISSEAKNEDNITGARKMSDTAREQAAVIGS